MGQPTSGRPNQRQRTRNDLLQAATRLMGQGRKPSLEEIAEQAMVSRATAYRYFPHVDALLLEAALDVSVPDADAILADAPDDDAVARLERVDAALHDMIQANEMQLRTLLVHALQQGMDPTGDEALPARQNRRTQLIEAALSPVRGQFRPAALRQLSRVLALVIGTEAMVVFKDVLQLDATEAAKARRWAIRALVDAARKPA